MVFVKANKVNVDAIMKNFENLNSYAGLRLNINKSKAYFSKYSKYRKDVFDVLKIAEGKFLIKYMGFPLFINQIKDLDCSILIEKIQERMETWPCKLLSITGRLELIKTIVHAIILYWLQTFHIPAASITKIKNRCADCLWRVKYHKISWDKFVGQKMKGGLTLKT